VIKKVTTFFASSLRAEYDKGHGFHISVALRKARQIPVRLLEAYEHRDRYTAEVFCRQDFEGGWKQIHLGSPEGRRMDDALRRTHRLEAELQYCHSNDAINVEVRLYGHGQKALLHQVNFVVGMGTGQIDTAFEE
jgi:hypothetical protein